MADLERLAVEDRVKASYRISPKDINKTVQAVLIENGIDEPFPIEDAHSKNINIYEIEIGAGDAGAEKSQVLSDGTRAIIMNVRKKVDTILRVAFNPGETSSGPYYEIDEGSPFILKKVNLIGKTLYVQGDKDNRTIQIIELS